MARPNVRLLENCELTLNNGDKMAVAFGRWYIALKVVTYADGFCDVHFADGRVAENVNQKIVEGRGVHFEEAEVPVDLDDEDLDLDTDE